MTLATLTDPLEAQREVISTSDIDNTRNGQEHVRRYLAILARVYDDAESIARDRAVLEIGITGERQS